MLKILNKVVAEIQTDQVFTKIERLAIDKVHTRHVEDGQSI